MILSKKLNMLHYCILLIPTGVHTGFHRSTSQYHSGLMCPTEGAKKMWSLKTPRTTPTAISHFIYLGLFILLLFSPTFYSLHHYKPGVIIFKSSSSLCELIISISSSGLLRCSSTILSLFSELKIRIIFQSLE